MKTSHTLATTLLAVAISISSTHAFAPSSSSGAATASIRSSSASSASSLNMAAASSLVVVSPPGGIGEVTVVKAASMGSAVKWFVVSSKSAKQSQSIALSQDALATIKAAGGSVALAGADAEALLDEADALAAVKTWCAAASDSAGPIESLVCCMDGAEDENVVNEFEETRNPTVVWQNAVKLAAKEAASAGVSGRKVAIMSADEDDDEDDDDSDDDDGGGGGLLGGLLGGGEARIKIPSSLSSAMKADTKLRHGTLFGIPESNPAFSALVFGPQKNPTVCDEYTMRMVRIDPSISISGNAAMGKTTQTCRHAIGEAAAVMATSLTAKNIPTDVCVTSLGGTDKFDLWQDEFDRVQQMMDSGRGAQLFETNFASVPSIDRLGSWIATKWAPAVMRTYDIAAIRTGARPVSATQIEDGVVEIVWQELMDNYESATTGRMTIRISDTGMVATRGPGDPKMGYGSISRKPLNGEAVLVRRLADAASQAMEKGLAKKPASAVKPVVAKKAVPEPVSSRVAPAAADSGPRQSGARRSSERSRGGKRTRRAAPGDGAETKSEPGAFE